MKRLLFTLLLLGASLQARPPETIPNDTPEGLLLCGYQGWFNTPGDGSGRGWRHYRGHGRAGSTRTPPASTAGRI